MKRYPIRRPAIPPEDEPGIIRLGFCDLKLGPCSVIHDTHTGLTAGCAECIEFNRVIHLWLKRFGLESGMESARDPKANFRNAREKSRDARSWHQDCGLGDTRWLLIWSSCYPTDVRRASDKKDIPIAPNELVVISNVQYEHRCRSLLSTQNEPRWFVVVRMGELPDKIAKLLPKEKL